MADKAKVLTIKVKVKGPWSAIRDDSEELLRHDITDLLEDATFDVLAKNDADIEFTIESAEIVD